MSFITDNLNELWNEGILFFPVCIKTTNLSRNFNLKFAILIFKFSRYCNSDHWYSRLGSLIMMGRQPFRKGNILLRQRKSVSGSQKLSEKSKCSTVNHAANERQYKQTNVVVQGSLSLASRQEERTPGTRLKKNVRAHESQILILFPGSPFFQSD